MERKQIAVIGLGVVGERHLDSIRKDGRADVCWICDQNKAVLKRLCAAYPQARATENYREILADSEVDAVMICTPPYLHYPMLRDVVKAGKHVLVEKPLCVSRKELERMCQLEKSNPQLVMLEASARHSRLFPKFRLAKEFIDRGKLGEIYLIHHNSVYRQNRPGIEYCSGSYWFLDKKKAGGGALMDLGVYDLSFHLGLLNDVPELETLSGLTIRGFDQPDIGGAVFDVEEHAAAFMTFHTGLRYYYERSSNAHNAAPNETRIYGTKGGLRLSSFSWDPPEIEYYYIPNEGRGKAASEIVTADHPESDDLALARHFVDCLEGKAKPMMPLSLAAKHLDILFQIAAL